MPQLSSNCTAAEADIRSKAKLYQSKILWRIGAV